MLVFNVDFTDNLGALLPIDRDLKFYYVKVILQTICGLCYKIDRDILIDNTKV